MLLPITTAMIVEKAIVGLPSSASPLVQFLFTFDGKLQISYPDSETRPLQCAASLFLLGIADHGERLRRWQRLRFTK